MQRHGHFPGAQQPVIHHAADGDSDGEGFTFVFSDPEILCKSDATVEVLWLPVAYMVWGYGL